MQDTNSINNEGKLLESLIIEMINDYQGALISGSCPLARSSNPAKPIINRPQPFLC
jgi:hypothetical protein